MVDGRSRAVRPRLCAQSASDKAVHKKTLTDTLESSLYLHHTRTNSNL